MPHVSSWQYYTEKGLELIFYDAAQHHTETSCSVFKDKFYSGRKVEQEVQKKKKKTLLLLFRLPVIPGHTRLLTDAAFESYNDINSTLRGHTQPFDECINV